MRKTVPVAFSSVGLILLVVLLGSPARGATRTVDNTSDNGGSACTATPNDCSFRGAVAGAVNGDVINFDPSLNGSTITLLSLVSTNRSLTITGPGANLLTISGGGTTSIFEAITASLNMSGLTLANGNGVGGSNGGQGGAVEVNSGALATFDGMVFQNNSAAILGGAMLCYTGTCRISNSTFTGNSAPGASVLYNNFGTFELTNTTVTGNTETSANFGAIYLRGNSVIRNSTIVNNPGRCGLYISTESTSVTLANTILAGNGSGEIFFNGGTIASNGGNFIGRNNSAGSAFTLAGTPNGNGDYVGTFSSPIDPQLAKMRNFGGPTPTRPLLAASLALNHGINCVVTNTCSPATASALTLDQRGMQRQIGAFVDIGAVETNFSFNQNSLPSGQALLTYDQTISATRQTSFSAKGSLANLLPLTYETIPPSGATGLPPGLTLETNGQLHGIPLQVGSFTFLVKVTDLADGAAGVIQYTVSISSPTAAPVSVSGRVFNPSGGGLSNAVVMLTDSAGISRTTVTGSLGYFMFEDVPAEGSGVVTVISKRYQFEPVVVDLSGNVSGLDLYPVP